MKVYEIVIDHILDLLEAGTVPWQRPWNPAVGLPRNVRGTAYRGINLLVLGCQSYESPLWLTFHQATQLGGRVRAGEHGTPVLLWKWPERTADTDDDRAQRRVAPLVRYYRVWNLLQTEDVARCSARAASRRLRPRPGHASSTARDASLVARCSGEASCEGWPADTGRDARPPARGPIIDVEYRVVS
jgi:antirestriction protein ArdC